MYFKQLVKAELGYPSYLVGDTPLACCTVIDPPLDMVGDILELAAAKGMHVFSVIVSDLHADHALGSRELARRTGATIYTHELAAVDYPHQELSDGIFRLFCGNGASTVNLIQQKESLLSTEANNFSMSLEGIS